MIANLLSSLKTNWEGILIFFFFLFLSILFIQWLAWIFSWGRFKVSSGSRKNDSIRFVIADLLVKIIDDFKHLLALVIMTIFAFALAFAMIKGPDMLKALQVVVASLGGLIGSIIGYYFGESSAKKAMSINEAGLEKSSIDEEDTPITEVPSPEEISKP